jgi:hypothetical protein
MMETNPPTVGNPSANPFLGATSTDQGRMSRPGQQTVPDTEVVTVQQQPAPILVNVTNQPSIPGFPGLSNSNEATPGTSGRENRVPPDQVNRFLDLSPDKAGRTNPFLPPFTPPTTTRQMRQVIRSSVPTGPLTASEIYELHEALAQKELSFTPVNTTPSQKRKYPATTRSPDIRKPDKNPTIDQYFKPSPQGQNPFKSGLMGLLSEVKQMQSIMCNTANISALTSNAQPPNTRGLNTTLSPSRGPSNLANQPNNNQVVVQTTNVPTQQIHKITTRLKHVTFQETNPLENTNDDNMSLSLQERMEIMPSALVPWRQSRSFLSAEAKARARADFVEALAETNAIPGWALGTDPLPGFADQFLEAILSLKRVQALELLQVVKTELQRLAAKHHETGEACKMTCQFIYGNNAEGWQKANELLTKVIESDKSKCLAALQKRESTIRQNLIDDEKLKTHLLEGPRNTNNRRPPANRNRRSRSRSPATTTRGRGRGRNSRQSPSDRPGPRPNAQNQNTRMRSRSNDRVIQYKRDNNQSRARSPQNGPDTRSTNSLWNDNATRSRKPFRLSAEEEAVIKALRQNKN